MLEFELAADRAAVDLLDQPIIFQLVEIAPNGFLRNTEFIRQLIHVNPAVGWISASISLRLSTELEISIHITLAALSKSDCLRRDSRRQLTEYYGFQGVRRKPLPSFTRRIRC